MDASEKLATKDLPTISQLPLGEDKWWEDVASLGLPIIEKSLLGEGQLSITFLWRDPYGTEKESNIYAVYIDINCITNHQTDTPTALKRITGTDIWIFQVEIEDDWRGSYRFIPITNEWQYSSWITRNGRSGNRRKDLRKWWRGLVSKAITDPMNRTPLAKGAWRSKFSAVHLPGADRQTAWVNSDNHFEPKYQRVKYEPIVEINWNSDRLNVSRSCWVFTCGNNKKVTRRSLILLLDGDRWKNDMPLLPVLSEQTHYGNLPPAVYVLVESIDFLQREKDLTCNDNFWIAIQEELLPVVHKIYSYSTEPKNTVIVGQSLGGLSAMYAGLKWPNIFGSILSQSGSFWWPEIELMRTPDLESNGWLTEQILTGAFNESKTRIYLEVGSREAALKPVNYRLFRALSQRGFNVEFRQFSGGHDTLCWRNGLIMGLSHLLKDQNDIQVKNHAK